jgi:hypothetical protein
MLRVINQGQNTRLLHLPWKEREGIERWRWEEREREREIQRERDTERERYREREREISKKG